MRRFRESSSVVIETVGERSREGEPHMKISQAWLWKTAVVVAGTMGGMSVAGRLLGAPEVAWEHPPGPMELFVPSLIGAVLTVSALVYPVTRSALRGGRLLAAVFLAVFGIHVVLVGVEAMVFLVMPTAQLTSMVTTGTVHAALLASLLVLVFGRQPSTRETPLRPPALGPGLAGSHRPQLGRLSRPLLRGRPDHLSLRQGVLRHPGHVDRGRDRAAATPPRRPVRGLCPAASALHGRRVAGRRAWPWPFSSRFWPEWPTCCRPIPSCPTT